MASTPQEYWDACLIKTWREHKQLFDTLNMFQAITGHAFDTYEPPLKRTPHMGMPWKCTVRHFVAAYLPKISERLWEQPPEKDMSLLRKLTTSNYTTLKIPLPTDRERAAVGKEHRKNLQVIKLDSTVYSQRNDNTNGSVVKGSLRHRRLK